MFNVNYLINMNILWENIVTSFVWGLSSVQLINKKYSQRKFKDKKLYNVLLNEILKIYYKRSFLFSFLFDTINNRSHVQHYGFYNKLDVNVINNYQYNRLIYCNYNKKELNKNKNTFNVSFISKINENKIKNYSYNLSNKNTKPVVTTDNDLLFKIGYRNDLNNDIDNYFLNLFSYRFGNLNENYFVELKVSHDLYILFYKN